MTASSNADRNRALAYEVSSVGTIKTSRAAARPAAPPSSVGPPRGVTPSSAFPKEAETAARADQSARQQRPVVMRADKLGHAARVA